MAEPKFGGPLTEEGRKDFWKGFNNPWPEILGIPPVVFNTGIIVGAAVIVTVFVVVPIYNLVKGR